MTLGERIREYRTERGYSIQEVGRRAEIAPSVVWNAEQPTSRQSVVTVTSIARALGVTVADLIGEDVNGGRIVWQGPLRSFLQIALVVDYDRLGMTLDSEVQIRMTATAGLAGQPAGDMVTVDAVGADVVPETGSGGTGSPTSSTGGPPAGA